MAIKLHWEEPPAAVGRRGVGREVDRAVEELKKNPGKWARVEDNTTSPSAAAKWKSRGCDAVLREAGEGMRNGKKTKLFNVYARWVEPDPAPDPAKEFAKKATPQELAKAYAEKNGAALAGVPRQQHLTEEQQVNQAWRERLSHGKGK